MAELFTWDAVASFLTLTFLEIVLSVDNILFVAIAAGRLPEDQRALGRQLGLWLALALRVGLLAGLMWITRADIGAVHVFGRAFSVKNLVLVAGGVFLLYKAATEIHDNLEPPETEVEASVSGVKRTPRGLMGVVVEIGFINIVFSLDSVVTAIGMARQFVIMAMAVCVASLVMMLAAAPAAGFIERRPTAKMLALAFILLVGVLLIAEGTGVDVPKGYLYFAIVFSLLVEALNSVRAARRARRGGAGVSAPDRAA